MGVVLPQPISFGKYTLFERIGRGGMADVFKARVQGPGGFERIFVIKRILPHLSDDPTFTKMFMEEAKLAARLNHPNIVQVFELDSVDGEYFMSMEYVRGRDLAETMRTLWARVGPPRPELVAYVGREMCRALAYAHDFTADDGTRLGMIHRDISPSNVMLSVEGAVKLLDFGIAKALTGDNDETTTKSGTLKGKFAYMAPEQTMSNEVDRRIDIFATGIVLHEILTGRRLFKGENDLQTIEKVRQCSVLPPSLHNPLCPPELDEIVLRALAKNSDDRYQNGSEMAEALDDIVHAARFQPTQLAQLMTSLFPTDGGGEARATNTTGQRQPITGSVSPSRSNITGARLSTTGSASHSGRVTSTTVPPVPPRTGSHPRAGSGLTPVVPPPIPADVDLLRKPLFLRKTTWAIAGAIALAVGGFWFGARGSRQAPSRPAGIVTITRPPIQTETLDLAIQSNPSGAEVFLVGSDESLGKTPFRRKFEYREDKATFLLFRLAGYRDLTHELRPDWSGLVVLDPEPAPPAATPAEVKPNPTTPTKPGKGVSGPRSGRKKEPTGLDPFETGQSGPSRNVGRAANPF